VLPIRPTRPRASRLAGLLALALTLMSWACGGAPPDAQVEAGSGEIVVVDDAGRTVALERPATRVISLIPALTDMIIEFGAADRLIARTDYDAHPSLAHLPSAGGGLTPSMEWLVTLRPDLVLAWPDQASRAVVERLESLGVPAYTARPETIADVWRSLDAVGRLLGMTAEAAATQALMQAALDSVNVATAGRPRPGVLYLVGWDPPRTVSRGTFIHELIEAANGDNLFGDIETGWPEISLEAIVRRDPDVVIIAQGEVAGAATQRLSRLPGWRDLSAVRTGRVHEVDPDVFNRPGPALARAARILAALLHPDAFNAIGD